MSSRKKEHRNIANGSKPLALFLNHPERRNMFQGQQIHYQYSILKEKVKQNIIVLQFCEKMPRQATEYPP